MKYKYVFFFGAFTGTNVIRTLLFVFLCMQINVAYSFVEDKEIKAAWIIQLMQYIKWQSRDYNNINICFVGSDSVGKYLKDGNKKENIRIKLYPDEEEYSKCHIIYIAQSEEAHIEEILRLVRRQPVVTLSSIRGFAKLGGMVQFVGDDDGTVSLTINTKSAMESQIIIDGDLLNIANIINK